MLTLSVVDGATLEISWEEDVPLQEACNALKFVWGEISNDLAALGWTRIEISRTGALMTLEFERGPGSGWEEHLNLTNPDNPIITTVSTVSWTNALRASNAIHTAREWVVDQYKRHKLLHLEWNLAA